MSQVRIVFAEDWLVIKSHQVLVDDIVYLLLLLLREIGSIHLSFVVCISTCHSFVLFDALRQLWHELLGILLLSSTDRLGHLSPVQG